MIKIVIDPGHGGSDRANTGPTGYVEADGNLKTALFLEEALLERYSNVEVTLTRRTDKYLSLTDRGNMGEGADLFHSIHSNAGVAGARGCEVFYSVDLPHTQTFAAAMSKAIACIFNTTDRGAKTRESTNYPGEDYYTVIDRSQDLGAKVVLLSESLFHSDPEEELILKNNRNLRTIAGIMADVYGRFLPLDRIEEVDSDPYPEVSEWATDSWIKAVSKGIQDGEGPQNQVTEEQLMVFLDKLGLLD